MDGSYSKAHQLIEDNMDILHNMATALLERETLNSEDIDKIIEDGQESKPKSEEPSPPAQGSKTS